jgi:glycosyltransferase involved in cell wall biosynthesis
LFLNDTAAIFGSLYRSPHIRFNPVGCKPENDHINYSGWDGQPMNILTHPVHTGYQYDLSQTGHHFYSLDMPGNGEVFWDERSRPVSPNFHRLRRLMDADAKFDLILAHYNRGYHALKQLDLPLIYKEHCVRKRFNVPEEWLKRTTFFCFASRTAAERWVIPPEFQDRKVIIGMGMDLQVYSQYKGTAARVLVVGQNIASRGNEKGLGNLLPLSEMLPITVVGNGNEPVRGAIGPAKTYEELLACYQNHRVFLNPSNLLGMSTLEAMATGMPVVSFRMLNSDVIENGVNGFLVDSVDEAVRALKRLLKDQKLARELGAGARATIEKRFSKYKFIERWNVLFERAIQTYRRGTALKMWRGFDLKAKPAGGRSVAQKIIRAEFEYCRVGYDSRKMTFLPDGRVGEGAGGCEIFWDVKKQNGSALLELSSGASVTCRLRQKQDGSWRGRWLCHEKMPIMLSPLPARPKILRKAREVIALIAVRDEERYLEDYFRHLREFVDGFIVFDDNSSDRSPALIKREAKVLKVVRRHKSSAPHAFEVENRKALLTAAWQGGAQWVLCCDADERFETRFLQELRTIVRSKPERYVMGLQLRPLWGSGNQYRVDGIYSNRSKFVLFPSTPLGNYYAHGLLHTPWYPPILNSSDRKQLLPYNLYHLKSIATTDRLERYKKFKLVDPGLTHQPQGYEHLVSEKGAVFESIPEGRGYDS